MKKRRMMRHFDPVSPPPPPSYSSDCTLFCSADFFERPRKQEKKKESQADAQVIHKEQNKEMRHNMPLI